MSRCEYRSAGTLRRAGFCFSNNPGLKLPSAMAELVAAVRCAYRITLSASDNNIMIIFFRSASPHLTDHPQYFRRWRFQ